MTQYHVFANIYSFVGQLAQLVEPLVYTQVVGSSSLSLPIILRLGFSQVFFYFKQISKVYAKSKAKIRQAHA